MGIRIEMSPSIVELDDNHCLSLDSVRSVFPTAIGLCAQKKNEQFILSLHENVFSPPSGGWNAFERYEVIFAGSEYVWDRLERSLHSIRQKMEHDESPRSESPIERNPRERIGSFRSRLGGWKNRSDNGYGSMEMCLAAKGVNELEKQFAELSAILVGKDAIIDSQRRQIQSERKSNDELKEAKYMSKSQKDNWENKCTALESELQLLRQLSGHQQFLGTTVQNLNSELSDVITSSERKIEELQEKLTRSEANLDNISKQWVKCLKQQIHRLDNLRSKLEERSVQMELQKSEIGRCDQQIQELNTTICRQRDQYKQQSTHLHSYCDNLCHENVQIENDFMNSIPATQAPVHHNQRQVPTAQNVNMGVQNGGPAHANMNGGYFVQPAIPYPQYYPPSNPVIQVSQNTPVTMQHNEHHTFVNIEGAHPGAYAAFPYAQPGMTSIPHYGYMQQQPFYGNPPQYPYNSSAPVPKHDDHQQQKKPKNVLKITNPATGQQVHIERDVKSKSKPEAQQPQENVGGAALALYKQVAVATGQTYEKEEASAEVRIPDTAEPSAENLKPMEKEKDNSVDNLVSKSPSIEPTDPILEEEIKSSPAPVQSKATTPTPVIINGSETKEISNDEKAILSQLENQLQAIYDKNSDAIEEKKYDTDFLFIIREIVKTHKKTLPNLNSPDILVAKGLDVGSAQVHQTQGRMKFNTSSFNANSSSLFNPQWATNTNSSIVGANRKAYAGRHSDNKTRKRGSAVTGRPSIDRPFVRAQPQPPPEQLRKSENAWKPKRRAEVEEDDQTKFYLKARKDIRSIFNKITPSTYEELATEFFSLNLEDDQMLQTIAIDLIFEKAVEEPKFCSLYTRICKEQVDRGGKSFFRALISKCQATFEGSSTFATSVHETMQELEKESDPKKKADLEERLDLLKNKEKRCLLGNIKFISHLYTAKLLSDVVISTCAYKLRNAYLETKDEIYVQYGTELLELVAGIYFSPDSTQKRQKNNETDNVEAYIHWLLSDTLRVTLSTRVQVMIMNFEDFRKRGYVPRNAEKGPTTLAELRDDVKKQEERNKDERLAYESRQKEQRRDRPYAGRASTDKKNLTEKRMSAAAASSNVGNSSMKKIGTLRGDNSNSKLGFTNGSFFNQKNATNEQQRENTPVAEEDVEDGWTQVVNNKPGNPSQSRRQSQERKSVTPAPSQ